MKIFCDYFKIADILGLCRVFCSNEKREFIVRVSVKEKFGEASRNSTPVDSSVAENNFIAIEDCESVDYSVERHNCAADRLGKVFDFRITLIGRLELPELELCPILLWRRASHLESKTLALLHDVEVAGELWPYFGRIRVACYSWLRPRSYLPVFHRTDSVLDRTSCRQRRRPAYHSRRIAWV